MVIWGVRDKPRCFHGDLAKKMVSWWWVDGDLVGYNMWYAWHLSIFNMGCKNGISWWDDKSWIIHRYGDIWMGFNEILMGFYGIPYMIYRCLSALFFAVLRDGSIWKWFWVQMAILRIMMVNGFRGIYPILRQTISLITCIHKSN